MSPFCPSLLHSFSAHHYTAATVQSKASCIPSHPHAESGLGPLVLKCGCLNRLSWTLLSLAAEDTTGIRRDTWDGALLRCGSCSCQRLGTKKSHCAPRVRRCWCPLHPDTGAQTSTPPPHLEANTGTQVKHPYVSTSTDPPFNVECVVHTQKNASKCSFLGPLDRERVFM